jgi:hypothetical protein
MNDPIDLMRPWTIKSMPAKTIEAITAAARRDNVTVGQWLEKRVAEWEQGASGVPQGAPSLTDLTALIAAAGHMAQHTKLPGEVRTLINQLARIAQGAPPRPGPPLKLAAE